MEATAESRAIAQGEQPVWEKTFEHPEHGPLEFSVPRMPRVKDWLEHAQTQEAIASGVTGANAVLAAACAGMYTFMEVPVIDERREVDPDDEDHVTITKVHYDPLEDENVDFPVKVWLDWHQWRLGVVSSETKDQVKNSSGAAAGEQGSELSPSTTESPQPTQD